ncbi:hypothetical protein [Streptococcus sp. ST16]|uniref:hypothetical protein n=1 Tax=Streptococcus sp. ST16 TaxID=3378283 RepID=UPI0038D4570A
MANKKIKLTSPLSLKEVALESSQFDIPKKILVDFSKARTSKKFKDGKQTDILSHYILEGIDERTAKAVNDGLIDQEDVKSIKIEVHGSFEEIEETVEFGGSLFVELLDVQVKADWVEGRNAGYKAVKLVASGLKLAM